MLNLSKEYKTRDGKPVRGLKFDRQDEVATIGKQKRRTGRTLQIITGEVFMYDDLLERKVWFAVVWDEEGKETFGTASLDLVKASEIKTDNKQALLL